MKRSEFIQLMKTVCADEKYTFQHGFPYRMNEGSDGYPLFWLCPPSLLSRKVTGISPGELESETNYEATAYIHHLNENFTEEQKEEVWQEQEDIAMKILNLLPVYEFNGTQSDIISVTEIRCEPDEFQHKDGTISMVVTFKYRLYDCR